jgi:hypothetical protein
MLIFLAQFLYNINARRDCMFIVQPGLKIYITVKVFLQMSSAPLTLQFFNRYIIPFKPSLPATLVLCSDFDMDPRAVPSLIDDENGSTNISTLSSRLSMASVSTSGCLSMADLQQVGLICYHFYLEITWITLGCGSTPEGKSSYGKGTERLASGKSTTHR